METIASQLMSITESCLSTWFVNNYLRKCAQLCPGRVSRLFDDVSTSMKLQNAVSAVVDWRLNSALNDLWAVLFRAGSNASRYLENYPLSLRSCEYWVSELVKIDSCLYIYFTAVAFLHAANKTIRNSLSDTLVDALTKILGQFVGKRRYSDQLSTALSLSQAAKLMKVVVNNSRSTVPVSYTHLTLPTKRIV